MPNQTIMIVAYLSDIDKQELAIINQEEMQLRQQLSLLVQELIFCGQRAREAWNKIEKRHKLLHGPSYQATPEGEILKIIPQPEIEVVKN